MNYWLKNYLIILFSINKFRPNLHIISRALSLYRKFLIKFVYLLILDHRFLLTFCKKTLDIFLSFNFALQLVNKKIELSSRFKKIETSKQNFEQQINKIINFYPNICTIRCKWVNWKLSKIINLKKIWFIFVCILLNAIWFWIGLSVRSKFYPSTER